MCAHPCNRFSDEAERHDSLGLLARQDEQHLIHNTSALHVHASIPICAAAMCVHSHMCMSMHTVVAIPGCQLDYIRNELQSRIERLSSDPNLEAGRYILLIWILAWKS